jgi:hypothetical protein
MSGKLSRLEAGLAAENPPGKVPSFVDGKESDQELRKLIIEHVLQCPQGETHFHCPFRILSGLSHDSMTSLVKAMTRKACLSLFEMERECRADYAAKSPVANKPAA